MRTELNRTPNEDESLNQDLLGESFKYWKLILSIRIGKPLCFSPLVLY